KDHLQEEVAELVAQRLRIAAFDRLEHLVRLLDHIGAEALGGLRAIPRAAAGAAQPCHDVDEAQERVGWRALGHRGTVSAAHGRVDEGCTTGSPSARAACMWAGSAFSICGRARGQ